MTFPRLTFEFDSDKAAANLRKHGISFREATTVFDDPLAETFPMSFTRKKKTAPSQLAYHRETGCSSSRTGRPKITFAHRSATRKRDMRKPPMKNSRSARSLESHSEADPLEPRPLDLSKAVRGKYFDRMQAGTNIALIAPDLLDTFPDSESVNEALRTFKRLTKPAPQARRKQQTSAAR